MTRTEKSLGGTHKSIRAMNKAITPAAQVRREFRMGRPPKPGESPLIHPRVVWDKANFALANLRARMAEAKLDPMHVSGRIVYITDSPDFQFRPQMLPIEASGRTTDEMRAAVIETLGRDNVMAIGMVFSQFDEHAREGNFITFPYQFTTLSEAGVNLLKIAVALRHAEVAEMKVVN